MTLAEKANAVEHVFQKLDLEIQQLQTTTGLHCKFGCGKCCLKPDIEASVLEFLPFAFYLYHAGTAEAWYERLKSTDSDLCVILDPNQPGVGHCTEYKHRGLICRLFGYSARTNKYGMHELVTCQIIKMEQAADYLRAEEAIHAGGSVPVMSDYYMQLHGIDFELAKEFYPINTAIRRAIETVLQYYSYR